MAKITRKTQKIFGSNAGGTGITEYGSPAGGAPAYSTDLDDIQTSEWLDGWAAAALAGSEIPTFQDFNAIHYVATNQLGYLLQEGVPEYDAATEYHQFSIVKKIGTYELYGSIVNTNTGNALPSAVDDADWKYLGDLSQLVNISAANQELLITDQKTAGTDGGTFTNGADRTRDLNTVEYNNITGASLSANQITFTEDGIYEIDAHVPAYNVDTHAAHLYDVTNAARLVQGKSTLSNTSQGDSLVKGRFTISGTTVIEIRHRSQNTQASNGFGSTITALGVAVYSVVSIKKIS